MEMVDDICSQSMLCREGCFPHRHRMRRRHAMMLLGKFGAANSMVGSIKE